jgi:hypothetical protein
VLALAVTLVAGAAAPAAWAAGERLDAGKGVSQEAAPLIGGAPASYDEEAHEAYYDKYMDEAYLTATFDKYDPELAKKRAVFWPEDGSPSYYLNEVAVFLVPGVLDEDVNDILKDVDTKIVAVGGNVDFGLRVALHVGGMGREEGIEGQLSKDARVRGFSRSMAYLESYQPILGVAKISSVSAPGRVLDVQWGSDKPGAPLQLFDANKTTAQRFRILIVPETDFYNIVNVGSGLALDVPGGDARPGAAIWQHPRNGTDAQLFTLEPDGEGAYVIHPKLDPALALDLRWGGTGNGTALQLWESNGTDAQRFRLDISAPSVPFGKYTLTSALGTALDAAGNGGAPGTNVQAWAANGTSAQAFTLIYDAPSGYYVVVCFGSGLVLDVAGGSAEPGANAQLWPDNGTAAQRWTLAANGDGSYALLSAVSDMALDVTGGSAAPGANVQLWPANGTAAQRWLITPAAAG